MGKTAKSSHRKTKRDDDASLTVFVALVVGLFIGYISAEIMLYGRPHPLHWLAALGGALLGYLVGQIITRVRARHI